jgi:hypothetical protein
VGKPNHPPKPKIAKPAKAAKPKTPVKPKVTPAKPVAKRSMDDMPAESLEALKEREAAIVASVPGIVNPVKDATVVLLSPYGYFRVMKFDNQGNTADRQYYLYFTNKRSGGVFEVHGTIAWTYMNLVPNRDDISDFPIQDTVIIGSTTQDSLSAFSRYSLLWSQATNVVATRNYADYAPSKETLFIACTREFDTGFPATLIYKNWKGEKTAQYKNSRLIRSAGMPTQILLHETATSGNMNISGVRKEKTYYPIPHFCINNIDGSGNGHILQFVDIAEKTYHGEALNDRSVGIEFVNEPLQEKDHPDLKDSKNGIYLKTVLDKYPQLFIPFEFDESKADQTLSINKADILNWNALKQIEIGTAKTKAAEEKDGVVTLKFVKSDKFEHLASLMRLLQNKGGLPGLDIDAAEQHMSVVTSDKKKVFVFQHGYEGKDKTFHYAIDIRKHGIFTHGLIGGHHDGYQQALYMYLRLIKKQQPLACLQTMIDMLAKSKLPKGTKRPPITLKEVLTVTSGKEEEPKSPKDIKITSYLELP